MQDQKQQKSAEKYQAYLEDKIGAVVVLVIMLLILAGVFGLFGGSRFNLALGIGLAVGAIWLCVKMVTKD